MLSTRARNHAKHAKHKSTQAVSTQTRQAHKHVHKQAREHAKHAKALNQGSQQGSQSDIMYKLSNIRKPSINGFLNLKPILSAINTGTYKWAKFFVPLLKPFTSNNYTVKDSFDFARDITQLKF